MELACKGQYQDALILHLMYSFSLDPYHIYSLTFDGIINMNQIQYWIINHQPRKLVFYIMSYGATSILSNDIKKKKITKFVKL